MANYTHRIARLETEVDKLTNKIGDHDNEIDSLRKFKHATNGHIHNHNGKFDVIENQQKSVVEELKLIRVDIRDWIKKTNSLLTWQLSIKFMLVGGFAVGSVMVGGVIWALQMYLNYFHGLK